MGNNSIEVENHVATMALLHPFAIEFHAEVNIIRAIQFSDFLKLSYRSRVIKRLGDFPRMAFGLTLALQVTSSKVNAYGEGIIILGSLFSSIALPVLQMRSTNSVS